MERKTFYKTLKSFLKELVIVFPDNDEELILLTTSLNLKIIEDDEDILLKFYTTFEPLEELIINHDISLFNKMGISLSNDLFIKLNDQWNTFSDNNKTVIWDYIILLYRLSKQSVNKL